MRVGGEWVKTGPEFLLLISLLTPKAQGGVQGARRLGLVIQIMMRQHRLLKPDVSLLLIGFL